MSKYFSKDSELLNYNVTDDNSVDTTQAIPSTDNLTQPISQEKKEKLSNTRTPSDALDQDDYISLVRQQTDEVTDMVEKYSEASKTEIKQQFKKFAPTELFEKMNQILFVLAKLHEKVDAIESKLEIGGISSNDSQTDNVPSNKTGIDTTQQSVVNEPFVEKPQNIPVSEPKKKPVENTSISDAMPTENEVRNQLAAIKSGKVKSDGYTDNSVNLEEMFPNLDDEAYTAAYSSIAEGNKQKSHKENKPPKPGGMRNLTGF